VPRLEAVAPGLFRIVSGKLKYEDLGGVGRAAFTYQDETLRATLTASQDLDTSGGYGGLVQRTAFAFDVAKRFTYKLWGNLAVAYYLNSSKGRDLSFQEIDEQTWFISPYLTYEYSRELRFGASYSFGRINYLLNNTNAERNLVLISMIYSFPVMK
jgi:hypothetical protein